MPEIQYNKYRIFCNCNNQLPTRYMYIVYIYIDICNNNECIEK